MYAAWTGGTSLLLAETLLNISFNIASFVPMMLCRCVLFGFQAAVRRCTCLHNTGSSFILVGFHPYSITRPCIRLHDSF